VRELRTRPLGPDHIGQAYPLVQASLPQVPLAAWTAFAQAMILQEQQLDAGIVTVLTEQGYIAGLCSYRIEPDLVHGRSLTAEPFLAIDMFDRMAVVHALADAIEAIARNRRCEAIHTTLPEKHRRADGGLAFDLSDRGHQVEALRLCKILPQRVRSTP